MEGIDPEYSYYSWAKSFELVRSGKHQVAAVLGLQPGAAGIFLLQRSHRQRTAARL